MTLVTIGSASVPNQDTGHGLVAVPQGRSLEGVVQVKTPHNGWRLGYSFRFREVGFKGMMDPYNWGNRYYVAIVLVGQGMTGICLVGFASPSAEFLDGASGKARSGGCCRLHQYIDCGCSIGLDHSHQGEEGGAEALG